MVNELPVRYIFRQEVRSYTFRNGFIFFSKNLNAYGNGFPKELFLINKRFLYFENQNQSVRKIRLLLIIIIITGLFSCAPTYRYIYTASPANSPYFTEKGESELTGNYSSCTNIRNTTIFSGGVDIKAAYALSDHWAITTGYYKRKEKDIFSYIASGLFKSSKINYTRNLLGIGGGYFISLDHRKTITFNLYSGLALGKFSFTDYGIDSSNKNYSCYYSNRITKWFIQPSFNFMPGEYIRLSYVMKFSFVHYGNTKTSYTSVESKYLSLDMIDSKTLAFIEPSLNLQFGLPEYPWIKLDAGMSWTSNPFNIVLSGNRLKVRSPGTSIGLNFDFSKAGSA